MSLTYWLMVIVQELSNIVWITDNRLCLAKVMKSKQAPYVEIKLKLALCKSYRWLVKLKVINQTPHVKEVKRLVVVCKSCPWIIYIPLLIDKNKALHENYSASPVAEQNNRRVPETITENYCSSLLLFFCWSMTSYSMKTREFRQVTTSIWKNSDIDFKSFFNYTPY